jgi:hypothetical protein
MKMPSASPSWCFVDEGDDDGGSTRGRLKLKLHILFASLPLLCHHYRISIKRIRTHLLLNTYTYSFFERAIAHRVPHLLTVCNASLTRRARDDPLKFELY